MRLNLAMGGTRREAPPCRNLAVPLRHGGGELTFVEDGHTEGEDHLCAGPGHGPALGTPGTAVGCLQIGGAPTGHPRSGAPRQPRGHGRHDCAGRTAAVTASFSGECRCVGTPHSRRAAGCLRPSRGPHEVIHLHTSFLIRWSDAELNTLKTVTGSGFEVVAMGTIVTR